MNDPQVERPASVEHPRPEAFLPQVGNACGSGRFEKRILERVGIFESEFNESEFNRPLPQAVPTY